MATQLVGHSNFDFDGSGTRQEFQSVANDRWKSWRYDAKASGRLKYTNPKRERGTVPRSRFGL